MNRFSRFFDEAKEFVVDQKFELWWSAFCHRFKQVSGKPQVTFTAASFKSAMRQSYKAGAKGKVNL